MSQRRKWLIPALLLVALGLGGAYYWYQTERPPESARLLPEGDLILYANFRPLHLWDLGRSRPVQLESDYQDFVEHTGIQFERDLDELAMERNDTADGRDVESAEIFAGRFDSGKLSAYLLKSASEKEDYQGLAVYTIPNQGHLVRVCLLDGSRVVVTNMASVEVIHGIIDRFQRGSGGPALVKQYYRQVPVSSLAWLIDRIPAKAGAPQLPGGLSFSFLENTVAVASLRYNGDLLFRADVIAANREAAANVVASAQTFFSVYRAASRTFVARGNDPDVKAALDSIRVEQDGNTAVFTAAFSQRFLKKIAAEAGPEVLSATPTPATKPAGKERGAHPKK